MNISLTGAPTGKFQIFILELMSVVAMLQQLTGSNVDGQFRTV